MTCPNCLSSYHNYFMNKPTECDIHPYPRFTYPCPCLTRSKCQLCSGMFKRGEVCDCSTPAGIVKRIQYKGLEIHIGGISPGEYLQVREIRPASGHEWTGKTEIGWTGRKWRLSPHMTKGEIVQTAFAACLAWEEHECREAFKYKGQSVFSPHYNIESLVRLCEQGQFEERSKS